MTAASRPSVSMVEIHGFAGKRSELQSQGDMMQPGSGIVGMKARFAHEWLTGGPRQLLCRGSVPSRHNSHRLVVAGRTIGPPLQRKTAGQGPFPWVTGRRPFCKMSAECPQRARTDLRSIWRTQADRKGAPNPRMSRGELTLNRAMSASTTEVSRPRRRDVEFVGEQVRPLLQGAGLRAGARQGSQGH